MTGVKVRDDESFEKALRRFNKFCEKTGILTDIKKLELANHMLDLNNLELQQTKIKAHLDWIKSTQPDMELDDDQVLEHVNNANQINRD